MTNHNDILQQLRTDDLAAQITATDDALASVNEAEGRSDEDREAAWAAVTQL